MAIGGRGVVQCGNAPDVPMPPEPADIAIVLDVIHFLDDDTLRITLERLHTNLRREGDLVVRSVIRPRNRGSWMWRIQAIKMRIFKSSAYFRSTEKIQEMIERAGFSCQLPTSLQPNEESAWFNGKAV
jgi:cyclopropane fatty-acyl-phospholipid synthase-like methyltransferase